MTNIFRISKKIYFDKNIFVFSSTSEDVVIVCPTIFTGECFEDRKSIFQVELFTHITDFANYFLKTTAINKCTTVLKCTS